MKLYQPPHLLPERTLPAPKTKSSFFISHPYIIFAVVCSLAFVVVLISCLCDCRRKKRRSLENSTELRPLIIVDRTTCNEALQSDHTLQHDNPPPYPGVTPQADHSHKPCPHLTITAPTSTNSLTPPPQIYHRSRESVDVTQLSNYENDWNLGVGWGVST